MPNHVHGIIEISRDQVKTGYDLSENIRTPHTILELNLPEDNINVMVETGRDLSTGNNLNAYQSGLKHDRKNHHAANRTGRDLSLQTQPLKIK